MDHFSLQECARCGKALPLGSLKYVIRIKVFADYDGVIEEPAGHSEEQFQRLIDSLRDADPQKLEEDVYMERAFILCHPCREWFVKTLLGFRASNGENEGGVPGLIH